MRLPCSECRNILYLGNMYGVAHTEDGNHLLCSKECEDKLASDSALEKDFRNLQQALK